MDQYIRKTIFGYLKQFKRPGPNSNSDKRAQPFRQDALIPVLSLKINSSYLEDSNINIK